MASELRILVVEDNDELRETLVEVLRGEGHIVTGVDCAEAVPEHTGWLDLMLIDLNLPGEDGLSLAKRVRASQPDIGMIMTTARNLPADRKRGYESGADIYMAKPLSFDELCSAITSLARRLKPMTTESALQLDTARLRLAANGNPDIPLTPDEAAILAALSRAADHRLEYWQLIELLNKDKAQDPKAALEVQIVRLRKKLQDAGVPANPIKAIRGRGYQICAQINLKL